jgi:hypothetical protein
MRSMSPVSHLFHVMFLPASPPCSAMSRHLCERSDGSQSAGDIEMTTLSTSTGIAQIPESRSRPVIAIAALAVAAATILVAALAVSLLANPGAPASTFSGPSLNESYQHVLRENGASTINAAPILEPSYKHVLRENQSGS